MLLDGLDLVYLSTCSTPMSLVFAEEKCSRALLDFLCYTDVGRISGVVEEAENSDHEESSDGGV